jgi:hypothetical protein
MKIFNFIKRGSSEYTCRQCAHFQNDPSIIEAAFPGLTIVSSGFASVRDQDGLCDYNQLYLSAHDSCPHFTTRNSELQHLEAETHR